MKKISLLVTFVALMSICSFAQLSPISKGQLQFNLGSGISNIGVPIRLGFDVGLKNNISIGPEISYRNYSNEWGNATYNHDIFGFSLNGNYHFNQVLGISPNWDIYAGINAGFYHWKSDRGYSGKGKSGLGFGLQVGGRYYWNDFWGINAEFSGGNTVRSGKLGLSVRF